MVLSARRLVASSLLAAASAIAGIVVGWAQEPLLQVIGLTVAGALAITGVWHAQPSLELPGPRGIPEMLPPDMPEFFGDQGLLLELVDEERQIRTAAERRTGPGVILLHGKPGVGKTHLAFHLAKRLARYYPDGQLYGRIGGANDRSPSTILVHFLMELGLSEGDATIPQGKTRYDLFLAKTNGKRLLVVLAGVRNVAQLNEVMPNSPESLVIVTSRTALGHVGGCRSHLVREPEPGASEQILLDRAGAHAGGRPDRLAQIVEQCGHLPFALCAAGEQARTDPDGLDGVAAGMTDRAGRLEYLSPPGRNTLDLVASEYRGLLDREQNAFRSLALVQSASFVPWVLQPLLDVGYDKAADAMIRLRDAQLVERVDSDVTGSARYRLHPLFRLFAERELSTVDDEEEVRLARERLGRAYAAAAGEVFARIDPDFHPTVACPPEHRPEGREWPERVARMTRSWLSVEFANLVEAIRVAHADEDWGTCWRIAAALIDAPMPGGDHFADLKEFRASVEDAFALGRDAAERDGAGLGLDAVWLAEAMHLVNVEKYRDVVSLIERNVNGRREVDPATVAVAQRITAQCLQLLAEHHEAAKALATAMGAATAAGDESEQRRIEFLQQVNDSVLKPQAWKEVTAFQRTAAADNALRVHALLFVARGSARAGNTRGRDEHLDMAYRETSFNAAGRAQVLLAHAEQELMATVDTADPRASHLCVHLAGHAVWAHQVLQCPVGVIRARIVLARALLSAGRDKEAEEQIRLASNAHHMLGDNDSPNLRAGVLLATGELGRRRGADAAVADLQQAIELFLAIGDFWHAARARLVLADALRSFGRYPEAFAHLWTAFSQLRDCGDAAGAAAAGRQLETIHLAAGMRLNVRSRKALRAMTRSS